MNFLSLIDTFLNEAARQRALAEEQRQFAAKIGLDRERFGEDKNQFSKTFDQRKLEADRGYGLSEEELALKKRMQETNDLLNLSNAVGRGAANIPQADVLSLLASKYGVPINKAALRSTAMSAPRGSSGYGGGGESGVVNAIRGLGQTLPPGLDWENRGGTWTARRYGFPS